MTATELNIIQDKSSMWRNGKVIPLPEPGQWANRGTNISLTKTERKIVTLFGYGLNKEDVCELLKISRQSLRKHIERMRKKGHAPD